MTQQITLEPHEDGAVSIRVTPIRNGYLVKGSKITTHFSTIGDAADAVADAIVSALSDD